MIGLERVNGSQLPIGIIAAGFWLIIDYGFELFCWRGLSLKEEGSERESERKSSLSELRRVCSFFRHLVAADLQHDHRYIIRLQAVQTALPLIQHIVISQCLQEKVENTWKLSPVDLQINFPPWW